MQRGDQEKFLKNHPKSSPRLKGPKALWCKWHYPLISLLINCRDRRRFRRKQRLQKCPNCQVMAIFARSPKNRIFWKSANRGPREIFEKSPKKEPSFERPKALWRKWHYPLISMLLDCKKWRRIKRKQRLKKCPNGQVIAIFTRSPESRIFWKSAKGGIREIFQKSPKK